MLRKKLKWFPLFSSRADLEAIFVGKSTVLHRSMFGEMILIRNNGEYLAFKNKCPHQNKSLEGCWIENDNIVCPFHRYQFSLKDGKGQGLYIDKYALKIENDIVYLGKEVWSLF